ncbi:MAG TPA: antibiotic biosynthesis monooxygenase [Candidatus Acidoferrales bacterium]|nr:antibiotic biosynthesis monooxygenase [Candidatus Acidoferrales bacterium]
MFARLVEATTKPGKRDEIEKMLRNDLLPVLKQQHGFVDMVGLSSDTTANEGGGLSLWETKDAAEAFFQSAQYTNIMGRIKPMIEDMKVSTFNVTNSTFHKIAAASGL